MNHGPKDAPKHIFSRLRRVAPDQQRLTTRRSAVLRYGVAVVAVVGALLLKLMLEPLIVQETPFLLVFAAVMVSAWYGGLGPGLLATILAGLATDYFFLPPVNNFSGLSVESIPLALYMLEGLVINGVVVALRHARQRAEASTREARSRQERLRQSEERFRLLVEGVRDYAILMLDPKGYVTTWNKGAQRTMGYEGEEVIGEHFSLFYTEEDAEHNYPEQKLRVAAAEGRYEEEGWRVRKDGSRFWANAIITAFTDEAGQIRGFSKVTRDITERRRNEEALRESEARYRSVIEQAAENIFLVDLKTKRILEANAALQSSLDYTAEELRRLTLYDIVDHDRESIDRNVERTLRMGHSFLGERRYRRRDGSPLEVEVNVSVITYSGRQTMSIVAHDVTERKRAEQRLKDTLDRLLALYEASQTLGSTLKSEEVVSRLLTIMQRVSHLTAAVISVPEEDGDMYVWRSVGLDELRARARYAAEAADARRAALETEEPQLFRLQGADYETEPLVGLCLPLLSGDRSLGVLEVYGTEALAESDAVELLGSLAGQAASALENARLYGELADRERRLQDLVERMLVAQEEERRHVAYEVHDGLAQVAVAAHTYLNAFARQHARDDDLQGREKLDRALELIEQTVREARRVIADLRPTALDDFGLATALRLEVEEFRSEDCEIVYEEALGDNRDARLPVAVETALFRVAQEGLTNIRKHAESPRVCVKLERLDGTVRLEVRDWGRGFELGRGTTKGGPGERVGLVGMQERTALLGGDLKIHSEPGAGTSIVAEVPLPEEYTENDR